MPPNDALIRIEDLSAPWRALYDAALAAREHAHAPYSQFRVGAAVRTSSGAIYAGANVENSSFGLTVCAERVAMWKAVTEGDPALEALVVVTDVGATPCGACRQVMSEFARDMPILVADTAGQGWLTTLERLLPGAYPYVSLVNLRAEPTDEDSSSTEGEGS